MKSAWVILLAVVLLSFGSTTYAAGGETRWRAASAPAKHAGWYRFRPVDGTQRRAHSSKKFRPKASSRLFQGRQRFAPEPFNNERQFRDTGRLKSYSQGNFEQFRPDRRLSHDTNTTEPTFADKRLNNQFRPVPRQSNRYRYPSRAYQPVQPEYAPRQDFPSAQATPWGSYGVSPYPYR